MLKEVEIKNPYYAAKLENGVTILVYDGYAEDIDGNTYRPVEEKVDDDYEIIGWKKNITKI